MSHSDAGWLHMEEPCNLMVIAALLEFSLPFPPHADIAPIVRDRLLRHERFRMRVVDPGAWPRWETAEVDLAYHLVYETVASREQLMERIGELVGEPLARERPLWRLHILQMPDGCAMLARLHHAMGDGIALMRVMMGLMDNPEPEPVRPRAQRRKLSSWLGGVKRLVRILLSRGEPATPLKGVLGPQKRVACSGSLDLDDLKRLAHDRELTLNDFLMLALTEAVREYLEGRGCSVHGLEVRAVVPVDLRAAGEEELGNRFGLVFVPLPVGHSDAVVRVKRTLDEVKSSPEAPAVYALIQLAGWLPTMLERLLVWIFGTKATMVVTNLPGPRNPCFLAGSRLERVAYWVPTSGRLALGISFLSYDGQLQVGVVSDAGLIPDPHRLVELLTTRLRPAPPA